MATGFALEQPNHLVKSDQSVSMAAHRWLKSVVRYCKKPAVPRKPRGVHLPDRLWRRQSALYMCLHDARRQAEE
ncbi:MAG: hypothetical protein ABW085_07660 [Sedimenticola sp.]